jgi:hypothetical protein
MGVHIPICMTDPMLLITIKRSVHPYHKTYLNLDTPFTLYSVDQTISENLY